MKKILVAAMILASIATVAVARTFGGYECTIDCSGHKAGYEWAEDKGITNKSQCDQILVSWGRRATAWSACSCQFGGRSL
jgi:hypothetical protein